jgi:class 3 adenylate cyclase
VNCPSCGHENRERAKFCDQCAAPVLQLTGASAHPRGPRGYTPEHLARKILRSKSALEGERKQVTVLFADVVGSMGIAEGVDPEEWHGLMDRFFRILTEGIHRFEGTINQYTGDGIMALFGAPIAHEDHAQRACYAALHLQEGLRRSAQELKREKGFAFSVRMGLNSGEVVVGKIGDDLRMDYTARGHTVGLAARMEQLASPGTVYLTEFTAGSVSGYFELEDLGHFNIAGVRAPVRTYQLRGTGPIQTRLGVSQERGFSPFVSRMPELEMLEAALNKALEGQGQVIGVVGEAGVGKSRLCYEFVDRCRARGITVHEAHCPAHGTTVPLLPVLELLRSSFGVTERDSERAAREKISGRLRRLEPALEDVLPLVFEFLGVPDLDRPVPPMGPEARQQQLLGLVGRLVRARSAREAAILLVDDLHWIDSQSQAFLARLVAAASGTRTLVLTTFRPEYEAEWMGEPYYHPLPLRPLDVNAAGEFLNQLLGSDSSLGDLPDTIRARTAGNPFFIEEVVQALAGSGSLAGERGAYHLVKPVQELAIPPTVQSVLAVRIDRLAEREKALLQAAAVIGEKFAAPLLKRVTGLLDEDLAAVLAALKHLQYIYEEALYPEAEYAFKHPLTREVAYGSQLSGRRAQIHSAVALALEDLHADKLGEKAALIAHHWEAAQKRREAARWRHRAALTVSQIRIRRRRHEREP